ncbi:MAG: TM2 domain-containing protein [Bernardetiaceae bacterium]|jgi:TM2 domain-containing membrane protein YozV|nr:TM2 domain-containing protein [Bernardetiaceae bacterium]
MKNLFFLLTFALGIFVSFAAAPPSKAPAELTRVELKAAKEVAKAQKKALKAEAKAQKKAARQAKYLAWVKRMASDANWGAVVVCFFLGWLGIHRVMMGGTGLLILGYIVTFGGFFGILPLVDFIRLIIDSSHYQDNDALFRGFQN